MTVRLPEPYFTLLGAQAQASKRTLAAEARALIVAAIEEMLAGEHEASMGSGEAPVASPSPDEPAAKLEALRREIEGSTRALLDALVTDPGQRLKVSKLLAELYAR